MDYSVLAATSRPHNSASSYTALGKRPRPISIHRVLCLSLKRNDTTLNARRLFVQKLILSTTVRCDFIRLSELDQPRVRGFVQGSTRQHSIPRCALSVASPTLQPLGHRAPQTIGYSHCQHGVLIMRVVICTSIPSDVVITY